MYHAFLFLLSIAVIWCASGTLIGATDRLSRRYRWSGFGVAFFVLGFLTSVSEFSVAINATMEDIPQVSAGNLLGASTVILLLIVPLLAVLGNGVKLGNMLPGKRLGLVLLVILLPSLSAFDGRVSVVEGAGMLLVYGLLLWTMRRQAPRQRPARITTIFAHTAQKTGLDIAKIVLGAALIFIAANILVKESIVVAQIFSIPVSFIGLLILAIGTNIPELVIAMRCILGKHKDIAFGDYMGSAAANTLLFGLLPIANGGFLLEQSEAVLTSMILGVGLMLFFVFAKKKNDISRFEGSCLLALYIAFLVMQIGNIIRISDENLPLQAQVTGGNTK